MIKILHQNYRYNIQAPSSFTALGTTWWFQNFSDTNGNLLPTPFDTVLSGMAIISDTSIVAHYKGKMRTADSVLNFNNQRKIVMDSTTGHYWFCYGDQGNIWLTRDTDSQHPRGCHWLPETRINNAYGQLFNPSITYAPPHHTFDDTTGRIIVTWEDSVAPPSNGLSTKRIIRYSEYNALTNSLESGYNFNNDSIGLNSYNNKDTLYSANPATPMVCPVFPYMGNNWFGRAVVVWSDDSSICIGIIDPGGAYGEPDTEATEHVPNSSNGHFPAIEPCFDPVTSRSDAVGFHLTWVNMNTKYSYLTLSYSKCSTDTIFCYTYPYAINLTDGKMPPQTDSTCNCVTIYYIEFRRYSIIGKCSGSGTVDCMDIKKRLL